MYTIREVRLIRLAFRLIETGADAEWGEVTTLGMDILWSVIFRKLGPLPCLKHDFKYDKEGKEALKDLDQDCMDLRSDYAERFKYLRETYLQHMFSSENNDD